MEVTVPRAHSGLEVMSVLSSQEAKWDSGNTGQSTQKGLASVAALTEHGSAQAQKDQTAPQNKNEEYLGIQNYPAK